MLMALAAFTAAAWLLLGRTGSARAASLLRPARERAEELVSIVLARLTGGRASPDPVALCSALAAELRAGAAPDVALLAVTEDAALVRRARAAALLGEPVAPALAADAACAGRPAARSALTGMAACWQAAADTGAGLADGLDRVAALAGAEQRIGDDLRAEIAAPRATGRILSLLPLLGIGLGELLGARPLTWLLTNPVGWGCLLLGAVLMLLGRLWSNRIVAAALPRNLPGQL